LGFDCGGSPFDSAQGDKGTAHGDEGVGK
jgi:hypothetical protein